MFCKNCGNKLESSDKFCAVCGQPVSVESENNNSVSDIAQPVAAEQNETVVEAVENVLNEEVLSDNSEVVVEGNQKVKSGKKKVALISGIIAAVAVIVAAVIFLWPNIENLTVKTFSDSKSYYQYVEKKNVEELATNVSSLVANVNVKNDSKVSAAESNLKLKIGDILLDYIAENANINKSDITWASEIGVNGKTSFSDKLGSMDYDILLNGKTLIGVDMIFDSENYKVYCAVPQLNEKYLMFDLSDKLDSGYADADIEEFMAIYESIFAALPDEETVNEIITRYLTVVIEACDDVEEESDVLEANGVSQKCTKLTVTIDTKTVQDIYEAVLKEVKNDKKIEKVIKDAVKASGVENADKYYDEFIKDIDEMLNKVDEIDLKDFKLKVITWVNGRGEAIGRELKTQYFDGDLYYYTARNGNKVGVEAVFGREDVKVTLLGEGTLKGTKLNADYVVKYGKDDVLNINVKNYDVALIEDNYLNGSFKITATEFLCDLLKDEAGLSDEMVDAIKNASVVIDVESSKGKASISVSLMYKNDLVVALSTSASESEVSEIKLPTDYIDIENNNSFEEYTSTITEDKIKKILTDAGIPQTFIDSLTEVFNNYSNSEPSYGFDDDFNYDYGSSDNVFNDNFFEDYGGLDYDFDIGSPSF